MTQRVTDQFGRDVHNLDHSVVRHAGWTDHTQGADHDTVDLIRRTHDRQFLEGNDLAFSTDVDPNAFRLTRYIKQAHQLRLLFKQVKSSPQMIEIAGKIAHGQQVSLTRYHDLVLRLRQSFRTRLNSRLRGASRNAFDVNEAGSFLWGIGPLGGAGSGGVRWWLNFMPIKTSTQFTL